jgi:ABC transporter substrate binding protein
MDRVSPLTFSLRTANTAVSPRWQLNAYVASPTLSSRTPRQVALAAKNATSTISVVTGPIGDPVGTGIVNSLARPGGNITGQTVMATGLSGKRLQLLKETLPGLSRVLVLSQRADPISALQVQELQNATGPLGIRVLNRGIGAPDELSYAAADGVKDGAQALVTTIETFFIIHRARVVELAAAHRLPAMYPVRDYVAILLLPSTRSLRARSPRTYQSKNRLSSSSPSTSRPPKPSASPSRRRCCYARIR